MTIMKCGHAANAEQILPDGTLVPCCVICAGIDPGAYEPAEPPDLTGRTARCYCCKTKPSSMNLPFFHYRGPGSPSAINQCVCGYYRTAHAQERHPNYFWCDNFTPQGPKDDEFYCGHSGWD